MPVRFVTVFSLQNPKMYEIKTEQTISEPTNPKYPNRQAPMGTHTMMQKRKRKKNIGVKTKDSNILTHKIPTQMGQEINGVPAQDLMVWILRSKTRTLARWVISPANLKIFIFSN